MRLTSKWQTRVFERIAQQKYIKSDPAIYAKLNRFGNEKEAIQLATQKMHEHEMNCKGKPSEMCPGTTVHLLVDEIKSKIEKEQIGQIG